MSATDELTDVFVLAGLNCARLGAPVARSAAKALAERLIEAGHEDVLAEIAAEFWTKNEARKARRDRWGAHARAYRAALDPGEMEPPAPPPPPPPPPNEEPPADEPKDRS